MSVIRGHRASEELRELYESFRIEDQAQLKDDVRAVLKTGAGRRVLMAILCREHVFGEIGSNTNDQVRVMIEVGRHNLAQEILAMANQCDCDAVAQATRERNELLRERNQRIAKIKNEMEGDR